MFNYHDLICSLKMYITAFPNNNDDLVKKLSMMTAKSEKEIAKDLYGWKTIAYK